MSENKNQLTDDKHVSRNMVTDEILESVFKKRFKDLTKDIEVRQKLAKYLNVSDQAIGQYRDGNTFPKTSNLIKIAQFFGCSLDYLIGQSDVFSPNADVQATADYTGLNNKAIEMLHLHNEKEDFKDCIDGLNFLLCDYRFYLYCLPGIAKIMRLSEKLSNYEFEAQTGLINDRGEISLDPYTAAQYFSQQVANKLESLIDDYIKESGIKDGAEALSRGEKVYLIELKRNTKAIEWLLDHQRKDKQEERDKHREWIRLRIEKILSLDDSEIDEYIKKSDSNK